MLGMRKGGHCYPRFLVYDKFSFLTKAPSRFESIPKNSIDSDTQI